MSAADLTQAEYVSLKRKLNTRLNRVKRAPGGLSVITRPDDPRIELWQDVRTEAQRGMWRFQELHAWPDNWRLWERTYEDACTALNMASALRSDYGWE